VGYGPLEDEIRALINKLNLQNEVDILINPPNITEILKSCDIYLCTSLFEGLSNSIMKAMSAGMPIIGTDVGDNRYLIEDGYSGYIVPCKDVDLIVDKLHYLINFEDIRKELGNNSQIKIGKEFSERELLEHYYELFSSMHLTGN
jgi:glycosyltransferase involved in cell wall biosynthesis